MVRKKSTIEAQQSSSACDHISSPPPSLLCALYYPASMYNQPAPQRDFSSTATSNSGQEDRTFECLRGFSPVQARSASFGLSNPCEPDAHGSDVFSLGSMGGGGGAGVYDQDHSSSLMRVSIGRVVARAYIITHPCSQVPVQYFL